MPSNVITARLYTGKMLYLGRVESGKLGDWYGELDRAEILPNEGDLSSLFDALCMHVQYKTGRTLFDPNLLKTLQQKARLFELGAARVVEGQVRTFRHRIIDTHALEQRFSSPVLKLVATI
jgi:hypothetical protein